MNTSPDDPRLQAEQRARVLIDRQLRDAGWAVQDRVELNLFAGAGVAVRETIMAAGHGRVDYLLYVEQRVAGVIEAKPEGTPLSRGGVRRPAPGPRPRADRHPSSGTLVLRP